MKNIVLFFLLLILLINPIKSQWFLQTSGIAGDLHSIFFTNSNTGFAAGSYWNILKTIDGGNNWTTIYTGSGAWYSSYFLNNNTGFVGGISLKRTTSSGNNWTTINTLGSIDDIFFVNSQIGFFVNNSSIYKTTDEGISWTQTANLSININLNAIYFTDALTGFVCGRLIQSIYVWGKIWKTTDGGYSWIEKLSIQNNSGIEYEAIDFSDNNHGYCAGYNSGSSVNSIVRTDNGGDNWYIVNSSTHAIKHIVTFTIDTIYVCGDNGIFKTKNAGIEWTQQLSGLPTTLLFKMFFLNSNIGWVVGTNGKIYKTTNGGDPVGINSGGNDLPIQFSLSQNYPNPFNPATKIKYDVPSNVKGKTSNVKLIVYDILGREIETLVNETKKPGSYEVNWDGSRYASGVYFYRLITDDPSTSSGQGYVETRKMVLIK